MPNLLESLPTGHEARSPTLSPGYSFGISPPGHKQKPSPKRSGRVNVPGGQRATNVPLPTNVSVATGVTTGGGATRPSRGPRATRGSRDAGSAHAQRQDMLLEQMVQHQLA